MSGLEDVHNYGIFENHWLLAAYGFLVWNIFDLLRKKNIYDTEWIAMLASLSLIPLNVVFARDLWAMIMDWIGRDWAFTHLFYGAAGFLSILLQLLISWALKKKNNGQT